MKKIIALVAGLLITLTACNNSANSLLEPGNLQNSVMTTLNADPKFASDQLQSIDCIPTSTDSSVFECGVTFADGTSGLLTVKVSSDGQTWLVTGASGG